MMIEHSLYFLKVKLLIAKLQYYFNVSCCFRAQVI